MTDGRLQVADEIAVAKAHAIFTPFMLSFYDLLVHGVSNHIAWRCPTQRLLQLYRNNLLANSKPAPAPASFSTKKGTVLFGATILGRGVAPNLAARALLDLYNAKGVFNNRKDDLAALTGGLRQRFDRVDIEMQGLVSAVPCRLRTVVIALG
jgi:hypothetical protein